MAPSAWSELGYNAPAFLALSISSLIIGYYLGTGHSLLSYSKRSSSHSDEEEEDFDSEEEDGTDLRDPEDKMAMSRLRAGLMEECKMVLVVRTDLKMDKGKIAAQCGHATLACYKTAMQNNPNIVKQWERIGQAKVALKCPTEQEMVEIERKAKALGLCARSILDAGRTQIPAGTRTVLGIGPGPVKLIDQVTGHLKLL